MKVTNCELSIAQEAKSTMVNQESQERRSWEQLCTRDAQESQVGSEEAGKVAIKARL